MNIENFVIVSLLIILLVYYWSICTFDYWKKRNIPFVKPVPLFGNILPLLLKRRNYYETLKQVYDALDGCKFGGYFEMRQPFLLIRDPKLISDITVRNFEYFQVRKSDTLFIPELKELNPLSSHLLSVSGDRWRSLRKKWLTTLTGSKQRIMSKKIEKCNESLKNYFDRKFEASDETTVIVETHSVFINYVIDVISACILDLNLSCMATVAENKTSRLQCLAIRTFTEQNYLLRMILLEIDMELLNLFRMRDHPKDVTDGFITLARDAVTYRLSLPENVEQNDFLKMLIDTQKDNFDYTEIASNIFAFFFAGFETIATSLCHCLYEIAFNPDVQGKLRAELQKVKQSCNVERIDYDAMKQLKYMDMAVHEALRMHPSIPVLFRECTKNYRIPDTETIIQKGVRVTIPVKSLHHNSDYFPNPEKFDPERFSHENKSKITIGSYMPFGGGPRNCVGRRLSIMILKFALAEILSNYLVSSCCKTARPLKYTGGIPLFLPANGVWISFEKVEK